MSAAEGMLGTAQRADRAKATKQEPGEDETGSHMELAKLNFASYLFVE